MKPSDQIKAALEGAVLPSEIEPASLSAMRFSIYKIACKVLALPTNEMKRKLIESHPEGIQTLIRSECRRIYDYRMPNMQRTAGEYD